MNCTDELDRSDGRDWGDFEESAGQCGTRHRFGAFAVAMHRELAPRGLLESILADRVILSAWTLQTSTEEAFAALSDVSAAAGGPVDDPVRGAVSGQTADRAERCLGFSLDLLRRIQSQAAASVAASRPASEAPSPDDDRKPGLDLEPDGDPEASLSNEWPVVPRGEVIADDHDHDHNHDHGDDELEDVEGPPTPAGPWQQRLVFDFSVSDHSPVVRGTWITAGQVVSLIVDGWSWSDILRAHPELTGEDIGTCLAYTVAEEEGRL
jgi:uncharacterized protein (DUF433 family)